MISKVIIQLFSLTIIVLFSSGFAQNRTFNFQDLFNINENLPRINQRILPGDFCGVSGWSTVVSVNAGFGECPNNFNLDLAVGDIKVCRGDSGTRPLTRGRRVHRTTFNVSGLSFTKVASFVEGYQFGSPDAFSRRNTRGGIDGITFSYGNSSSQHFLWAYAAGVADKKDRADCPCSNVPGDAAPSEFSSFQYCDTGNSGNTSQRTWFTEKVLWSGEGCPTTSTCCDNANLPYFCRTDLDLQKTRNADRFTITMRLSHPAFLEDIGITKLKIYVA